MNIQDELRHVFRNDNNYIQSALQDLFAIGCYLHATGRNAMGMKLCATALRGAKCINEDEILNYVRGNERECFQASWPHSELDSLRDEMPS
jgi:hypothetical protein